MKPKLCFMMTTYKMKANPNNKLVTFQFQNGWLVSGRCGAETRIFWHNWVNIMTADALAPGVARSSAAMLLAR